MSCSVATSWRGGVLRLATRGIAARRGDGVGAAGGRAYASNTVGTILGSFLAGFVLIPAIGMQETIAVAVAISNDATRAGAYLSHEK